MNYEIIFLYVTDYVLSLSCLQILLEARARTTRSKYSVKYFDSVTYPWMEKD